MKRVGVIGAGRFGMALTKALSENGVEVLLLERNGALAQQAASLTPYVVQGDATNQKVLQESGFDECDAVVVAIGSSVETSTLVTLILKDMGVKYVVGKASTELHGRVLEKLGADRVIYPDRDSARRLARAVADHGVLDLLEVSEGFSIAETDVPEECRGLTLAQSDLRKKTGVTVLCIRRADENPKRPRALILPGPNDVIRADDKLIVFGETAKVERLKN